MKQNYKDFNLLIALLCTSVISVYFMPAMVSRLIFLGILATAYRTKYDYVYLVWFFIINDAPGRLFSGGSFDAIRIPLYPVMAGISISFQELFLILYLFKYLSLKRKPAFLFKREFSWFLVFGIFVVGYSYLLGISFENMVRTFRTLLPWCLMFILPVFIHNRQVLIRSCVMLFPVVVLAFLSQIFMYLTNEYLESFLVSGRKFLIVDEAVGPKRSYSAVYLTLFSILTAFYFLFNRRHEINKHYLSIVIFFGLFSLFLTATRGWIIALSALIIGVLILTGFSKEITRWLQMAFVSVIVLVIVSTQFPVVSKQVEATIHRLQTLEALAAGDLTAGRTLARLDVRGPRVMSKFWQSPFIGWGFSNEYYDYADGHVGHENILLNVGIIGYVFVNGLFVAFCMKIWRFSKRREIQNQEGNSPLIYVVGLIAVFVIHSSSTQLWGYALSMDKIIFFAFLFGAVNAVILPVFMKNTTGHRA